MGVGSLAVLALTSPACASHPATSGLSFVIAANRLAGLRITPDTSYRQTLGYFSHTGRHGSSFLDGLCRLRFEKIGLSVSFITLAEGTATPAKCKFFPMAVATDSRWHTVNGLHVGATVASMRRKFPRAYNSGKIPGKHWGIPTGSTRWELTDSSSSSHAAHPILVAYVRGGHVAALGIDIVGH